LHSVDTSVPIAVEAVHFERRIQSPGTGRATWEPIPLSDVPPILFSEAMRDIDLIVSLATVGTEAQWRQWEAAREAGRPHWLEEIHVPEHSWAQTSENRVALLTQILPMLGLSDRVTLRGHFAFVRGRRHEYRVHLGTSNVLVEPSGRFVCIVPRPERDRAVLRAQ